jgi:hypothetical protein
VVVAAGITRVARALRNLAGPTNTNAFRLTSIFAAKHFVRSKTDRARAHTNPHTHTHEQLSSNGCKAENENNKKMKLSILTNKIKI